MRRVACLGLPRLVLALGLVFAGSSFANAQFNQSGVLVDAEGVLQRLVVDDPTGQLTRQRANAAKSNFAGDLADRSAMRKISLNRLEKELAKMREQGAKPSDEMKYLAGITKIQYVFFYPETGDIVLAGPAEAWFTDLTGRVRGVESGRPMIELEDLAVALRMFPPGGSPAPVIGCSIDPTEEGLQKMQQFMRSMGGAFASTPDSIAAVVEGIRSNLGLQTITVQGVPASTHFAQVMVEADYRMKLIGIGVEKPPVPIKSYAERAGARELGGNGLTRWYFMPDYQCVRVADTGLAMELVGATVKLVGADELVTVEGERQSASIKNRASAAFVNDFTKQYAKLAERVPVYAQLRNVIDLAVAAAYIQQQDFYSAANWKAESFLDESKLACENLAEPKQVDTVVSAMSKGAQWVFPTGGGVEIKAAEALDEANLLSDEDGKLRKLREETKLDLADGQWWWD